MSKPTENMAPLEKSRRDIQTKDRQIRGRDDRPKLPPKSLPYTKLNNNFERKIFYQKSHHVINAELSIQDQSHQIISVLRKN